MERHIEKLRAEKEQLSEVFRRFYDFFTSEVQNYLT